MATPWWRRVFEPGDAECPNCSSKNLASPADYRLKVAAQRIIGRPLLAVGTLRCRRCETVFQQADRGRRQVVGYHGCRRDFARNLVSGRIAIGDWDFSEREYDWIGKGVYFWEEAPGRAWQWARQRHAADPAVVAVVVTLGDCIDLGDTEYTALLADAYQSIVNEYRSLDPPRAIPENTPLGRCEDGDLKLRRRDRLVVDNLVRLLEEEGVSVQTVRHPLRKGSRRSRGRKFGTSRTSRSRCEIRTVSVRPFG